MKTENTKLSFLTMAALQGVIVIYTLAGIAAKSASGYPFMSMGFVGFYALEIVILGIYALLWQQIIKRMNLTIAYANRSVALIWSMLWAVLFFHEAITLKNIIGVLIIIAGTVMVNTYGRK
jgi:drug/metabolite transporter (DMT)-like permease